MSKTAGMSIVLIIAVFARDVVAFSAEAPLSGDAVIQAKAGESEIVIRTTTRLAGAIDSLTWNGREFIDSTDHGRQLQSASNFDAGSRLSAETYNPTEAGSRHDGAGSMSSSRLLQMVAKGRLLQTTAQMAFWLRPDETSNGQPAKNTQILSDHLLTKRVQIGYDELSHVIQYNVTFSLPVGESHRQAVFEAVTGYMPADFCIFSKFNPVTGQLDKLDDGPGEQSQPVVMSTEDRRHAMGIYSPEQPAQGYETVGYGRFRFPAEKVVKWNCVFRRDRSEGLAAAEYSFRNFVVVGDLSTVAETIRQLHQKFESSRSTVVP